MRCRRRRASRSRRPPSLPPPRLASPPLPLQPPRMHVAASARVTERETKRRAQGRPWGVAAGATAPGPTKVVGPHPIKIIPHIVRYLQPAPPENLFACSAKPVRLPYSADGCSSARRPPPPGACSPAAWTAGRLIGDRPGACSPAAWTAGRLISDRRSPTRLRAESPTACA
jgi:hypothetical protein